MKFLVAFLVCWMPITKIRKKWRMSILQWIYARRVVLKAKSVGPGLRLGGECSVTRFTEIGENVTLNGLHIYGDGKAIIASHIKMGPEVMILTQNHNYESNLLPYGTDYVTKDVTLGECVWIGARVTILPGTSIGEGAIIQAGSVVHGNIPPLAIAGGNPAKVFAWRDKEHYAELRRENAYIRW